MRGRVNDGVRTVHAGVRTFDAMWISACVIPRGRRRWVLWAPTDDPVTCRNCLNLIAAEEANA